MFGMPIRMFSAAVNQVARKINHYLGLGQDEFKLLCHFVDDLESIRNDLLYLEDMLKNAENNSFGSERANLRHWLSQMKSLAYDIEDMVDVLMNTILQKISSERAAAFRR